MPDDTPDAKPNHDTPLPLGHRPQRADHPQRPATARGSHSPSSPPREYREPGASITPQGIRVMVERFYEHARSDELLGPVFNARVKDWDKHYDTMTRFWSSAVLHAGTYSGRPIEAHRIDGLTPAHFVHWVRGHTRIAREVFAAPDAEIFVMLGHRMAVSISQRVGVMGVEHALAKAV